MRDRPGRHRNRRAHNRRPAWDLPRLPFTWDDDGNLDWEDLVVDVYRVDNTIRGVTGPRADHGDCGDARCTDRGHRALSKLDRRLRRHLNPTIVGAERGLRRNESGTVRLSGRPSRGSTDQPT